MPKGPQGQKRPANVTGCAVTVMKIATGEIEETRIDESKRKAGKAGGVSRAKSLTKEKRQEIAQKAIATRWGK